MNTVQCDCTCDSCGQSLVRCMTCGEYEDEDCRCEIPDWREVSVEWQQTLPPTHWEPGESEMVCQRCPGSVEG
jgi:hypothetical protein